MTLAEELLIATSPVVLTGCASFVWLIVSDHFSRAREQEANDMKHRLHDERWAEISKEIGALKSMCELNNKIIIRRGWANLSNEDEPKN